MLKSPFSDVVIPENTVHDEVLGRMEKYADEIALVNGETGQQFTYRQVIDLSKRTASALSSRGVSKGDVIAFYLSNRPEFAVMLLGSLAAGATVTTVNPTYTKYELCYHLKDSGTTWILTDEERLPTVRNAMEECKGIKEIFTTGKAAGTTSIFELFKDSGSRYPTHLKFSPKEDVAVIPYSSGTTGLPKGVMLTHFNIVANMTQFCHEDCSLEDGKLVALVILPFFHVYGMNALLLCSLVKGYKTVSLSKFDPVTFYEAIPKYKVELLPLVPPIIVLMSKSALTSQYDLSSLKYASSGAAPLKSDTEELFKKRTAVSDITNGYGMTEVSCTATLTGRLKPKKLGSVGFLLANMEAKIVDPSSGKVCGPNERGELWMRGPNIMKGYLNKPEATRKTLDNEGFLHSGDIAYYDEEGYLFIVDRIKELIKYKGFQVAPAELEGLLLNHPDVDDVGVTGIPDEDAGELPKAFIVRRHGSSLTEKDVQQFVAKRAAPHKKLRGGVQFLNEIPKSASGKILRKKLAEINGTPKSQL